MKVLRLKVSGMSCDGCATTIEKSLSSVNGVFSVQVSYKDGTAKVIYDPSKIKSDELLTNQIFKEPSPYRADVISDEDV